MRRYTAHLYSLLTKWMNIHPFRLKSVLKEIQFCVTTDGEGIQPDFCCFDQFSTWSLLTPDEPLWIYKEFFIDQNIETPLTLLRLTKPFEHQWTNLKPWKTILLIWATDQKMSNLHRKVLCPRWFSIGPRKPFSAPINPLNTFKIIFGYVYQLLELHLDRRSGIIHLKTTFGLRVKQDSAFL